MYLQNLVVPYCFLLLVIPSYAQERINLKGAVVNDHRNPLPFATIRLNNGTIGTVANQNGMFAITLSDNHYDDTIRISYVGYKPFMERIEILSNKSFNTITLYEDVVDMSEVVT